MGRIISDGIDYSGLIQANGCFVDTTNLLLATTSFRTSYSYTATEDCFVCLYVVPKESEGVHVDIDGEQVAAWWRGSAIADECSQYVRKGQTISVVNAHASYDSFIWVYGLMQGSPITFLSEYASACYSTIEREVGCWIDGKPIYQKTIYTNDATVNNAVTISVSSLNIDSLVDIKGTYDRIVNWMSPPLHIVYCFDGFESNDEQSFIRYDKDDNNILYRIILANNEATSYQAITIRYTKTTDVAGSGQWTPMAQPTHHYSTEEQVIGTWIDGKPIYEITLNPTVVVGSNTLAHGIANFKECISIKGKCKYDNGSDVLPLPYVSTNAYYAIALGNVNATNYLIDVGAYFGSIQDCYVTIQYTKTTD